MLKQLWYFRLRWLWIRPSRVLNLGLRVYWIRIYNICPHSRNASFLRTSVQRYYEKKYVNYLKKERKWVVDNKKEGTRVIHNEYSELYCIFVQQKWRITLYYFALRYFAPPSYPLKKVGKNQMRGEHSTT